MVHVAAMLVRVVVDESFREDLAELIPVNEIRSKGMLKVTEKSGEDSGSDSNVES